MKSNEAATCQRIATDQARRLTTTVARLSGILAICLWAVSVTAETTTFKRMAFQSYLVDSNGTAIDGSRSLKFSIFDAVSDGDLQWAETQTVTVNAGNFSVILGEGSTDTAASSADLEVVFDGSDCYIEIAVDGTTLAPRLRILPSPYTFHAKNATHATNATLATNATNATNAQKIISGGASLLFDSSGSKFVMNKPLNVTDTVTAEALNVSDGANVTGLLNVEGYYNSLSGNAARIGWEGWTQNINLSVGNTKSGAGKKHTAASISGPGGTAIGFHSNRYIYFIDALEEHYTASLSEGGVWTAPSDLRLKKDVEVLGGTLDKLESIRGVRYKLKNQKVERPMIGVIAQDLEKHFPELIDTMPNLDPDSKEEPYMAVNYNGLGPVLIEAVKELRAEKDEQIKELEARLAKLEAMFSEIKKGQ